MSGWVSDYLIYNLEFFGYKNIKWDSNVKLIKLIKIVTIYNALIVVHTAYPEAKSLIIIIQTSGALSCRKEHLMPGSEKKEVGAITDLRSLLCHWSISFSGHAVEPSEEEEESTTNEVFYAGYPGGETRDWSSLFQNYIFGELFTSLFWFSWLFGVHTEFFES